MPASGRTPNPDTPTLTEDDMQLMDLLALAVVAGVYRETRRPALAGLR